MWKEEHYNLLLKHWKGQTSEQEKQQIQAWLQQRPESASTLEELEAYYQNMLLDQATYDAKGKGLHLLRTKIAASEAQQQATVIVPDQGWRPALKQFLAVAASLMVVFGTLAALYLFPPTQKQVSDTRATLIQKETGKGQRSKLLFPDGSIVYLNAESSITYSSEYFINDRTVQLQGEAFFEVAPDSTKPFRVKTANLTTQVLGTSFNIQAYPGANTAQISVATGKVSVQENKQELQQLRPNQQLTYDFTCKSFITEYSPSDEAISWTKGEMVFRNTPLRQIAEEMERWYDVQIVIQDDSLADCRFTATFDNLSLKDALYLLSIATNLTYNQHGRTITLQGRSCK